MNTGKQTTELSATVGKGQVTHPHLLTPRALKMAEGRIVNGATDADWDSYCEWMERREKVEQIVNQLADKFKNW